MSRIELNRREKYLLTVLVVLLLLMVLSNKPELIGVTGSLVAAWAALVMFFVAIGVMLFVDPFK
jgi:uncharacterized membrane protein